MQVNAEIVVTFEGTTEFGNPFMARQSYLMDEVMWGHQFAQIIHKPEVDESKYRIDFSRYVSLNSSMVHLYSKLLPVLTHGCSSNLLAGLQMHVV